MSGTTPTAAVLVIGDEVLAGKVEESNAAFFIPQLRELGVALRRVQVIPDDPATIAAEVRAMSRAFDLVFTSGGVGPTHDDLTIPAIAEGLERPLVRHPEFEEAVRRFFGQKTTPTLLAMARLPEGAACLWGEGVRFPVIAVENVYIFPGAPELLRHKFLAVRERFRSPPFFQAELHLDLDEEDIAEALRTVQDAHPGVAIGSYPKYVPGAFKVLVTVEAKEREAIRAAVEALRKVLPPEGVLRVTTP